MSFDLSDVAWIGVDWGTTNFRAYAQNLQHETLANVESNSGMSSVAAGDYESVLTQKIQPWLRTDEALPVLMSGMVGARQGWVEAPYRAVPCGAMTFSELLPVTTISQQVNVFIVPGVCQSEPADVMRGEETQVFGWLADNPDYEGVICLPGTHSKWVLVVNKRIQAFKTWMTGELFDLLGTHSVLQHSVGCEGFDDSVFLAAAKHSLNTDNSILGSVFSVRAKHLLSGVGPMESRSTLSGLLIGAECAAALKEFHTNDVPVPIIGSGPIVKLYSSVLAEAGVTSEQVAAAPSTLAGLQSAAVHVMK